MAAGEETDWEARAFDLEKQVNELREQLRLASAAAPHIESALLDRMEDLSGPVLTGDKSPITAHNPAQSQEGK